MRMRHIQLYEKKRITTLLVYHIDSHINSIHLEEGLYNNFYKISERKIDWKIFQRVK